MAESKLTSEIYTAASNLRKSAASYIELRKGLIKRYRKKDIDYRDTRSQRFFFEDLQGDERFQDLQTVIANDVDIIESCSHMFSSVSAIYPVSSFKPTKYIDQMGSSVHCAYAKALRTVGWITLFATETMESDTNKDDPAKLLAFINAICEIWKKPSDRFQFHLDYELDRLVDKYGLPENAQTKNDEVRFSDALGAVEYKGKKAILGDKQYLMFKYVHKHKEVKISSLIKNVWSDNCTEGNVNKCMKRVNESLETGGLLQFFELSKKRGHIILSEKENRTE